MKYNNAEICWGKFAEAMGSYLTTFACFAAICFIIEVCILLMIRSRFNPTLLDNRVSGELETGNDNFFKCIFSYFANFLILQLLMNQ